MSDDLVNRLQELADCDTRAGEPLGNCMREAADRMKELEAKLAQAVEALKQNGALGQLLDLDADKCRVTFDPTGWPDGLSKPINNPDTGDNIQVAHLDVEDSGYGPQLWVYAISVLKASRAALALIEKEQTDE